MRERIPSSVLLLIVVIAVAWAMKVAVDAQSGAASVKPASKGVTGTFTPPRTVDGQPDMQGVWNYSNQVPLERPARFAGEFMTDAELAAEKRRAEAYLQVPNRLESREYEFRIWHDRGTVAATKQTSLVVDPPDGQMPPLTTAAEKRVAAYTAREQAMRARDSVAESWLDRDLWERCITTRGGLPKFPGNYNNNLQIFQSRDHFVLLHEQIHEARIIPLDGRPHVSNKLPQWLGDSRGRWDGNTLIVETTGFSDKTLGQVYSPSFREPGQKNLFSPGATLRLIERFTRSSPGMLIYEFTIDDPTTWTQPWTVRYPMYKSEHLLYEYACHEGNYSMANGLSSSRATDGAAEGAREKK